MKSPEDAHFDSLSCEDRDDVLDGYAGCPFDVGLLLDGEVEDSELKVPGGFEV